MRTHSVTVMVRSAHNIATSCISESDSLPVSSECKAQRCCESQSRQLKNEGDKIFPPFAWMDRQNVPLCTAFASACATTKLLPMALHPPFNNPRSALAQYFQKGLSRCACPTKSVPRGRAAPANVACAKYVHKCVQLGK